MSAQGKSALKCLFWNLACCLEHSAVLVFKQITALLLNHFATNGTRWLAGRRLFYIRLSLARTAKAAVVLLLPSGWIFGWKLGGWCSESDERVATKAANNERVAQPAGLCTT
ncbi:hypothetical protein DL89DRAFT_31803 [Linderina pennispora]|uniref:Secreted protein n=1 Tax=Linderina pennispora TaxID=61395 RepID=A0A1Y1W490_9FUNG|nr:uncharacterized protein DL89DRAFT_31803 [Linderina pennispora]ORX68341.1 hypothetical protein DL89DRAFT_31803 [Linderina pennispora]